MSVICNRIHKKHLTQATEMIDADKLTVPCATFRTLQLSALVSHTIFYHECGFAHAKPQRYVTLSENE